MKNKSRREFLKTVGISTITGVMASMNQSEIL
jgi:hypothetical protein